MSVVYYVNFFGWREVAKDEHLRTLGSSYEELDRRGVSARGRAACPYSADCCDDQAVVTSKTAQSPGLASISTICL